MDRLLTKGAEVDFDGASGETALKLSKDLYLDSQNQMQDVCMHRYSGLRAHLRRRKYDCCLLMIGTNDLAYVSMGSIKPDDVEQSIMKLHQTCHKLAVPTLALSIPQNRPYVHNDGYRQSWEDMNGCVVTMVGNDSASSDDWFLVVLALSVRFQQTDQKICRRAVTRYAHDVRSHPNAFVVSNTNSEI